MNVDATKWWLSFSPMLLIPNTRITDWCDWWILMTQMNYHSQCLEELGNVFLFLQLWQLDEHFLVFLLLCIIMFVWMNAVVQSLPEVEMTLVTSWAASALESRSSMIYTSAIILKFIFLQREGNKGETFSSILKI